MRKGTLLKTTIAALALLAAAPAAQAAQGGVRVGTLACTVDSGWGRVVASSRDMNCTFHPLHRGAERYRGTLTRYGVDVGYTSRGELVWAVVAPTSNVRRTALEGDYAGASANATVGVGAGANVLVGGFDRSIALQPLSVEGNTGLALAAGVGVIRLRAA